MEDEKLGQLKKIGFARAGKWVLAGPDQLDIQLGEVGSWQNVLYALVVDGRVAYVGKTARTLQERLNAYRFRGAPTQTTNVKNRAAICDSLCSGKLVEVWALKDRGLIRYGDFALNLAAGLEDDVIRRLDPPWNGPVAREITGGADGEDGA